MAAPFLRQATGFKDALRFTRSGPVGCPGKHVISSCYAAFTICYKQPFRLT